MLIHLNCIRWSTYGTDEYCVVERRELWTGEFSEETVLMIVSYRHRGVMSHRWQETATDRKWTRCDWQTGRQWKCTPVITDSAHRDDKFLSEMSLCKFNHASRLGKWVARRAGRRGVNRSTRFDIENSLCGVVMNEKRCQFDQRPPTYQPVTSSRPRDSDNCFSAGRKATWRRCSITWPMSHFICQTSRVAPLDNKRQQLLLGHQGAG